MDRWYYHMQLRWSTMKNQVLEIAIHPRARKAILGLLAVALIALASDPAAAEGWAW